MASRPNNPPVIAVVGETASGKTALALTLAEKFSGEIIAADSRTVYKELSIGTAKPTNADRLRVPHHLLDVISPNQVFTAADFKLQAQATIDDIAQRGKVPFLVGGSGLYIDALLYDFQFRPRFDRALRARLNELSVSELQAIIAERALPLPYNSKNPRHLIRTIETDGAVGERSELRSNTLIIGLKADAEQLRDAITRRVYEMFAAGLVAEAQEVAASYGWDAPGLSASGYRVIHQYVTGQASLETAHRLFIQAHLQLAKRQRTWFKRNQDIHWIYNQDEAVDLVTTFLSK